MCSGTVKLSLGWGLGRQGIICLSPPVAGESRCNREKLHRRDPTRSGWFTLWVIVLVTMFCCPSVSSALNQEEMTTLLKLIDDRQKNSGDHKTLAYIEQKEKNKNDLVYQVVIYRRDAEDKFMILFLEPKSEAGKGYLRLDKNLFMYDPSVGKWERRTERERIGGTDSRRADFDESRLVEEYTPSYAGEEKLGKYTVHHLKLEAKKDADTAYPILHLWIDKATSNTLKLQEYALSPI